MECAEPQRMPLLNRLPARQHRPPCGQLLDHPPGLSVHFQRLEHPSIHPRHSPLWRGCYGRAIRWCVRNAYHVRRGFRGSRRYLVFFYCFVPTLYERRVIPDFFLCQCLCRILVLPHGIYFTLDRKRGKKGSFLEDDLLWCQ